MNLSSLPIPEQIAAILTAAPEAILSAVGALRASQRRVKAGPPKVMRPCPKCGAMLGAREMRQHKCKKPPTP